MQDKAIKGRAHRLTGLSNGKTKLSDKDVMAIRLRLGYGDSPSNLAKEFSVDPSTISHIKSGRDRPFTYRVVA